MKLHILFALALGLSIVSCKKEDNNATILEEASVSQDSTTVQSDSAKIVENAVQTTSVSNAIPSAQGGGNLNPEHGQPGHRCDLPVGAPLSGTPTNSVLNSPVVQQPIPQPVPQPQPISPAPTAATGNLNPEHGQPGHRCELPVGAPLS